MKTPQEFHDQEHSKLSLTFEGCWRCGRDRAKCKAKVSYSSMFEANAQRDKLELTYAFDQPLRPYHCRWCQRWHLTSKMDKFQARRGEVRRRRWLAKKEEERRNGSRAVEDQAGDGAPGRPSQDR